ncbi:MAG: hypothetical protein MZV64_25910 [Ignavibacteriales bacterium]|nr:hypothetical protein [Ignavibacteriales bacterium]
MAGRASGSSQARSASDRGDHFHLGIDIGGGEQVVRPVLPGELVFRYEENADYTSLPRGVAATRCIRHAGRRAVRLLPPPARPRAPRACDVHRARRRGRHRRHRATPRASTCISACCDGQTGSWVNPLSLLPPVRRPRTARGEAHWPCAAATGS